jgi:ribulose-phosphate 3-epimerase
MAKILPSINCHLGDDKAVAARVRDIEKIFDEARTPAGERIAHFDIADGIFTFNKSWDGVERLAEIKPAFQMEVHLMVENPRPVVDRWLAAGVKRVIVHLEAAPLPLFAEIAVAAQEVGAEVVLALNPETSINEAVPYFNSTSNFLILGVHPGLSGQKFLPLVLEKVSFLRREVPNAKIEVDGGMNLDTARAAVAAGADSLVSGSDIFDNSDPEGEYEVLRSIK